jgi:signal transduction histidine kinase
MMAIIREVDQVYIDVNEVYEKIMQLKRKDLIGKSIRDLTTQGEVNEGIWAELLKSGEIKNLEVPFRGTRTLLLSAVPIMLNDESCFLFSHNEITDFKKTQAEFSRLDRLNLIGQMAAGIGHEIRNPLTTVRGYLQLLGIKQEYASHTATFNLMISELDRANSIITEFLTLARNKPTDRRYQNINSILNNLYPLLEADAFTQNKQIVFIPEETIDIHIDSNEISQLILNLFRNGLEAMAELGCLTIRTYMKEEQVVLSVHDEGCGIMPEDVEKLGIPFFTTKDNGTGLGLAMCFSIANRNKASIDVNTGTGGTTFSVKFVIPEEVRESFTSSS